MLECLGYRVGLNRQRCPETVRALDHVPNLIQAFFSILEPGKSVPKHEGPYLGYLRYHLGVTGAEGQAAHTVVNGQDYVWKEGEAVLFDDSWPHEVINHSDEMRAVLIIDVRRPLPVTADVINGFVTNVIGRRFYGRRSRAKPRNMRAGISPRRSACTEARAAQDFSARIKSSPVRKRQ